MRKLLLQMSVSLDGYVAGPNGEMDWIFSSADATSGKYVSDLLDSVDLILLGRKMSKDYLDYWPKAAKDSSDIVGNDFAKRINATKTMVVSNTLEKSSREDVEVMRGDIVAQITKLKEQQGKDIMLYGGATTAQNFTNMGLIDEYHLLVVPVLLGAGLPLFKGLDHRVNLKLVKSTITPTGAAILCYSPLK